MDQKLVHSHLPDQLSEFVSVDFPPIDDHPVLAIRRSPSGHANYELLTVRYQPDIAPLHPWRMLNGDSVLETGQPLLGWKNAQRWLQA